MRPLRLTVQGFTSFADRTEVDFSDLDLFAITGPTGAGKTSILDAMTWAMYGKTSRLGRCGSELISHGKNNVAVHFEFSAGMDRYRITRSTRRTGAAQVRLEKFNSTAWVPEDAAGVAETNAAIGKIVGLDFDAFKLSVTLPQGEFDCFLRGDHAERRKILKSLLGLEVFDRMREIAYTTSRDLAAKIAALQQLLGQEYADATDERLTAMTADLRQQTKAGAEEEQRLGQAHKLCSLADDIAQKRSTRTTKEADHYKANNEYITACAEASRKADEASGLRKQLEGVQQQHDGIVIDDRRATELVKLRTRVDELDRLIGQQNEARTSFADTQKALEETTSEQRKIQEQLRTAEDKYASAQQIRADSQKTVEELGSEALLNRLLEELQVLPTKHREAESLDGQILAAQQKQTDLDKLIAALLPQSETSETTLARAKEREQELTRHDAHRELRVGLRKGRPCPVCEQTVSVLPQIPAASELNAAHRHVKTCEKKLQEMREKITRAQAELGSLPGLAKQLSSQRQRVKVEIAGIRKRVHAITGALTDEACSKALSSKITAIRHVAKALKQALVNEEQALKGTRDAAKRAADIDTKVAEFKANIAAFDRELKRLTINIEKIQPDIAKAGGRTRIITDLEAIEKARKQKAQLADQSRKLQIALGEAELKNTEAERNAAVLGERVRSLKRDIADLTTSLAVLDAQWAQAADGHTLPEGNNEAQRAALWRDAVQKAHTAIQQRIAGLKTEITTMEGKIEGRAKLEKQGQELRGEQDIYDQIHNALRADRFIDHLLGRAYDDLCRRGSEDLMRLSGERYSFAAAKNTFNVKDGWNGDAERPAGTLSGGESFFASLALALALAESVSAFSADGSPGTRLEALFLDEGVSTLDQDEALPTVIDALMNLQAGDRMIGVISHMENLAQRLPARIEVIKNHGRSTVRTEGNATEIQLPSVIL
jgi:DNA repair protein SbcC/Rad50